ncbi:hypothetical protein IVB30_10495 [Bradyrhizobium sp. 200]|uniref:hypothetical protein n=1 Tax=Bradyrhizobium sp. 200 TaxID=2782665 RepID=UPI001FFFBC37|nr:hypothetical protein [Bradyrhizobium sp. 200]UPJ51734.1 hypothetical protein IVB30_10495 [Bradyrhizobium sp. 200]
MSNSFATLILVGPGELESARLQDVITSLFCLEPDCRELVLIDDGMICSRQQVQGWMPLSCTLTILKNPRNGVGDGWADGTTVGVLAGLKHLSSRDDLHFILRLDTDSAVFGKFSERIAALFQRHPECGMAGTFRKYPSGEERIKPGFMIERQTAPYPLARFLARLILETWNPRLLITALRRRALIRTAEGHGYRNGEYVQGGGHAFSARLLRAALSLRLLDDPFFFFHSRLPDDTALTIVCYALGFVALDFNEPGQVFAVVNNGLPDSPSRLFEKGYAIAHSVKADPRWTETEIREVFSRVRQKLVAPA